MKLEIYYKPTCPFCVKVLRYIEENSVEGVELKDKSANRKYEQELIAIGGKSQVPCLFIDGKPLYESDDIMSWLKENLLK